MAKPKQTIFGAPPRVDLLPDAQRAEIRHEQTLPKLLLALIASAVIAALIWAAGLIPIFFAEQNLIRTQNESQQLNTQIAEYEETQEILRSVGSRESDRQVITANEVLFMELRDELVAALPGGVDLVRFTAELAGTDAESAEDEVGHECVATGVTTLITISTTDVGSALDLAAEFIDGVRDIEGFACGNVIDRRAVSDGESGATELQVRVAFDETVRSARFAEEV